MLKSIFKNSNDLRKTLCDISFRKISNFFGIFTCLTSLVLAFLFKDYLIYLLEYLEKKSDSNIIEFHLILILLYTVNFINFFYAWLFYKAFL